MKKQSHHLLIILLSLSLTGANYAITLPEPVMIANAISQNQSSWIVMQANIQIKFQTTDENSKECFGNLMYHRLDEKILLKCKNGSGELLFALKTNDSQFELYLPGQTSVFKGNIFDLADSEEIDSQLQPLAFYRALKVMRFSPRNAEIESIHNNFFYMKIYAQLRGGGDYLSRRMEINRQGHVLKEEYYNFEEKVRTKIRREEFLEIDSPLGLKSHFAKRIIISKFNQNDSEANPLITTMTFRNIQLHSHLASEAWKLEIPQETRQVNVRSEILPVFSGSL